MRTVARSDRFGFGSGESLDGRKVVDFLGFKKPEIAKVAGVAARTALWFKTPSPMLGNISPRDMIRYGRYDRLRRFVVDALDESATEAHGTA